MSAPSWVRALAVPSWCTAATVAIVAPPKVSTKPNALYYGDNLDVLRASVGTATVDLVYLDPPFNSDRVYNVGFASAGDASAQIAAFDDTWSWSNETDQVYDRLVNQGGLPQGTTRRTARELPAG